MSASTEKLLEQIHNTRAAIATRKASGQDASDLETYLGELNQRLETANQALNEGKQVLKG
jgi:hypothetical protein